MQTTAGSLALVGSVVPGDAVIVRRLRNAGAVILAKQTWANGQTSAAVTSVPLAVGWSARGGNTINAYNLSYTSGAPVPVPPMAWPRICARSQSAPKQTDNHWAIRRREHRWFETDSWPRFATGDYPYFPSTGHGRANGTQRDRRCNSSQRIEVALRSRSWSALAR